MMTYAETLPFDTDRIIESGDDNMVAEYGQTTDESGVGAGDTAAAIPESSAVADMSQEVQTESGKRYEYKSEDGTLQTADTLQEAMSKCPYLRNMSPERAERQIRMESIGRRAVAARAAKSDQADTRPKLDDQLEAENFKRERAAKVKEAQERKRATDDTVHIHTKTLPEKKTAQSMAAASTIAESKIPEPAPAHRPGEISMQQNVVMEVPREAVSVIVKASAETPDVSGVLPAVEQTAAAVVELASYDTEYHERSKPIREPLTDPVQILSVSETVTRKRIHEDPQVPDVEAQATILPAVDMSVADTHPVQPAMAVYAETELYGPDEPRSMENAVDQSESVTILDRIVDTNPQIPLRDKDADAETFQEILAMETEAEIPVSFTEITQEVAEHDQPLDETLLRLAAFMEHAPQMADDKHDETAEAVGALEMAEDEPIQKVRRLLAQAFEQAFVDQASAADDVIDGISVSLSPAIADAETGQAYADNDDPHDELPQTVQLTPELTRTLLELIDVLGYENPPRVLLDCARQHDIGFVLQAIYHMGPLTNDAEHKEFLRYGGPVAGVADDTTDDGTVDRDFGALVTSLGRAIMGRTPGGLERPLLAVAE